MKTFKKIDYKGKYFILQDPNTPDEYGMDFEIGEMKEDQLTDSFLLAHNEACRYYGIPAYIGSDVNLKERLAKLDSEYDLRYNIVGEANM